MKTIKVMQYIYEPSGDIEYYAKYRSIRTLFIWRIVRRNAFQSCFVYQLFKTIEEARSAAMRARDTGEHDYVVELQ